MCRIRFKLIVCILIIGLIAVPVYCNRGESTIPIFDVAETQQCIWGEWKISEMYFGGVGWQECRDDRKDVYIQFLPDSIIYDGQATEVVTYHNTLLAIENRNALFHEVEFQDLGFEGDYFLEF